MWWFHSRQDNGGISVRSRQTRLARELETLESRVLLSALVSGRAAPDLMHPVGATMVAVPAAPSDPVVTALSTDTMQVSWSDAAGDETAFLVERRAATATKWTLLKTVAANVTTFTDAGLKPNTQYIYEIIAKNSKGLSVPTDAVTGTTMPLPTPASNLNVSVLSTTGIQLSWSDNSDNETGFRIVRRAGNSGGFKLVTTLAPNTTSYTDSKLNANTKYTYEVIVFNDKNSSSPSNQAFGTTMAIPAAPANLTVSATTPNSIQLNWTEKPSDQTAFEILQKVGSQGWTVLTNVAADVTSYLATGLTANTPYTYEVLATNGGKASGASKQVAVRTGILAASAVSPTSVQLTWTATSTSYTGFQVERKVAGTSTWTVLKTILKSSNVAPAVSVQSHSTSSNSYSFTDTGLAPGTQYNYQVVPQAGKVTAAPSNLAVITTPAIPSAPSDLVTSVVQGDSIQLSWTDNSNDETGFEIERQTGTSGSWTLAATVAANTTSYTDTNLQAGTTYTYAIVATNAGGTSASSNQASATTDPAAPTDPAPSSLVATALSTSSIQLTWVNNSSSATGLEIEREAGTSGNWTLAATLGSDATSYTDTGLQDGTAYTYTVIATYGDGTLAASEQVAATTALAAPTNVSVVNLSATSAQVGWSDDSPNVTGFEIERETGVSGNWTVVGTVAAGVLSFTDTSLQSNTLYTYEVLATNAATTSVASVPASSPNAQAPAAATGLTAVVQSSSQIKLTWTDNSSNETGFKIARSTDGVHFTTVATTAANVTTYTDGSLSASTPYYYLVLATDAVGDAAPSNMASATTMSGLAPTAPTLASASTFSAAQVNLNWTDNANDEQGFVVQDSTDGANFTTVTTVASNVTSYSVTGLQPATTYYFRVEAENTAGTVASGALSAQTKQNVTVDGNGWTTIVPSADTRIIYVSSSTGNDNNSGLSANSPVQTIAKGVSLLRNGYPDELLLKSGDTFTTNVAPGTFSMVMLLNKSGRSATEPLVVGAYGNGARPTLDAVIGGSALSITGTCNNIAIIGLNVTSSERDPSSADYSPIATGTEGINFLSGAAGTTGLLIEDCTISYLNDDINLQGFQGVMNNVTIRRDIVTNSYSSNGAHSQGLYISGANNILLEDNIFDHNGWNASVAGAAPTIFNHNIYMQYDCTGSIIVRDNISANASSHGMQIRPGGIVENNLLVDDPNGILWGNTLQVHPDIAGDIINNVILNGDDINRALPGSGPAWGIDVNDWSNTQVSSVTIDGNIVADKVSTFASSHYLYLNNTNGVAFTNNVIYNWPGLVQTSDVNTTMSNNTVNGTGYLDPTRSLSSYNVTLGGPATDVAFLAAAEARTDGAWDSRYDALTVINYIRAGFNLSAIPASQ